MNHVKFNENLSGFQTCLMIIDRSANNIGNVPHSILCLWIQTAERDKAQSMKKKQFKL